MRLKVPPAIFSRSEEAVAFDQPAVVVGFAEREQRLPQLLDGLEGPHPQQVFLQRADEPLGAAIAFWCPHTCTNDAPRRFGNMHVALRRRRWQAIPPSGADCRTRAR